MTGVFVMLATIAVAAIFMAMGYFEGKSRGQKEGENAVWNKISSHIHTRTPMTFKFTGPGGMAFTTDYVVKEHKSPRDRLDQRGGVNFSKIDENKICLTLYRENRQVMTVKVDAEQIPKSLWGKNLDASLWYDGWDI